MVEHKDLCFLYADLNGFVHTDKKKRLPEGVNWHVFPNMPFRVFLVHFCHANHCYFPSPAKNDETLWRASDHSHGLRSPKDPQLHPGNDFHSNIYVF
eukprot:1158406-Pelagomonas_calceolata.AAC.8